MPALYVRAFNMQTGRSDHKHIILHFFSCAKAQLTLEKSLPGNQSNIMGQMSKKSLICLEGKLIPTHFSLPFLPATP